MSIKHELQNIISGNGSVRNGKIIQTITDYLRGKKKTIQGAAKSKRVKEQETQVLIDFVESQGLWSDRCFPNVFFCLNVPFYCLFMLALSGK